MSVKFIEGELCLHCLHEASPLEGSEVTHFSIRRFQFSYDILRFFFFHHERHSQSIHMYTAVFCVPKKIRFSSKNMFR